MCIGLVYVNLIKKFLRYILKRQIVTAASFSCENKIK